MIPFIWNGITGRSIETENRLVVAQDYIESVGRMRSDHYWVWGFSQGWWQCSKIDSGDGFLVNILKPIELYTLSGWIVWFVKYISILKDSKEEEYKKKNSDPKTLEDKTWVFNTRNEKANSSLPRQITEKSWIKRNS